MLLRIKNSISKDFLLVGGIFLYWRIILILATVIGIDFIVQGYSDKFLGGGWSNYYFKPEFFGWANFDGEHYLSIALRGYLQLQQTFFPIFPLLMYVFSYAFLFTPDRTLFVYHTIFSGLIISNLTFFISLILLWELLRMDFSRKVVLTTILLIILFPTSFYFGALYNESLFLLFCVSSFLCARKKKWFWAGIFGALASGTRVFGVMLLPALIVEAWLQRASLKQFWPLALVPLGLLGYMIFLWLTIGDPIAFYTLQKLVGEQRQSGFTLIPQVYYRYINMIMTVPFSNSIFQIIVLELICGVLFLILPIIGYFQRIRVSYIIFALLSFFITTVQGSFSSVPRYVLIMFPSFLSLGLLIQKLPTWVKIIIWVLLTGLLFYETALFLRGYWIA